MAEVAWLHDEQDDIDTDQTPPIAEHGPFKMYPTCVVRSKMPTLAEWHDACQWVQAVEKASPFWLGDLMLLADLFGEDASQAYDTTAYAEQTCANAKSVCKAIPPED